MSMCLTAYVSREGYSILICLNKSFETISFDCLATRSDVALVYFVGMPFGMSVLEDPANVPFALLKLF